MITPEPNTTVQYPHHSYDYVCTTVINKAISQTEFIGASLALLESENTLSGINYQLDDYKKRTVLYNLNLETSHKINIIIFLTEERLISIYKQVIERIRDFFPNDVIDICLKKDIEDNTQTLFIYIKTSMSIEEAFSKRKDMLKNWTLVRNHLFNKYINISTRSYGF